MTQLNELRKRLTKGRIYRRTELASWSKSVNGHLKSSLKRGQYKNFVRIFI